MCGNYVEHKRNENGVQRKATHTYQVLLMVRHLFQLGVTPHTLAEISSG